MLFRSGGIVVGALGGGRGILGVLVELAFLGLLFFFFFFSFFSPSFLSFPPFPPSPWGMGLGPWLPPILVYTSHGYCLMLKCKSYQLEY